MMEKGRDTSSQTAAARGSNPQKATLMKYLNNRMDKIQSQMGFNQTMRPETVNQILTS
jgi:hypothetical protein